MPVDATEKTFAAEVDNGGLVLVDFWAAWCGPCKMLTPVLNKLDDERDDIKVVKVNVDENSELARDYRVMGIPTMILFKNGEPVKTIVGAKPRAAILEELADFL